MHLTRRGGTIGSLGVLWAIGLIISVQGGMVPSATRNPNRVITYPWRGVVEMCLIITAEVFVLGWILMRPREQPLQRSRIGIAFLFLLVLCIGDLLLFSGATDLPGYMYSNALFLLVALALLVVMFLVQSLRRLKTFNTTG